MNMGPFSGVSQIRPVQQPQPLQLKTGQVFHGTVQKLFPEQTAELNVGGQRFVAKLEVPLKAGDSHYFVVTSTTPDVTLKITGGPVSKPPTDGEQVEMLARSLGLPHSKEMMEILTHIVSRQVPMSKEQMAAAESWLKLIPPDQHSIALIALEKMAIHRMPFTEAVFRSIVAGGEKGGLMPLIEHLGNALKTDQSLPFIERQKVMNAIEGVLEPFRSHLSVSFLANSALAVKEDGASGKSILPLLKQSGILQASASSSDWALETLVKSGKLPEHSLGHALKLVLSDQSPTLTQSIRSFNNLIDELQLPEPDKLKLPFWRNSAPPAVAKDIQTTLIRSFLLSQPIQDKQIQIQLLSLLGMNGEKEDVQQKLQELNDRTKTSGNPIVKQLLQNSIESIENTMDSKMIESAMKSVLRGMGLGYEHALIGKSIDPDIKESLKPLLLSIINHPDASNVVKEAAEHVVNRLNGHQLLSVEAGQQQQIIMQVPLNFLGKKIDATINWNGKMKEDGKIDSDFARVLFYLQLSSIEETIVDMSVQNRVVSIQIYNADPSLPALAEPLRESLKAGLAANDYRLSGLSIKPYSSKEEKKNGFVSSSVKGVDIRI